MLRSGRISLIAVALLGAAACAPVPPSPAPLAVTTPVPSSAPTPTTAPATPAPTPGPTTPPVAIAGGWHFVGKQACPDSKFECVTLAVPSDHFTAGSPTWDVTFAILRASGKRLGTYVTITGGPGSSGILAADSYTDAWPASIAEHYDVVFLDQRGIGRSHPFNCPDATAVYYSDPSRPEDPAQLAAAGAAASTYVTACLAEGRLPVTDLPLLSTRQAVEDLEDIRQYLGADGLQLYGESYGTQYVQTYAAAYPNRIATLYLDGPVDLTLDAPNFYAESTRAFDSVLVDVLNTCASDRACSTDFGGQGPLAAWDELAARLATGTIAYRLPLGSGTAADRTFALSDLEDAAVGYLYSPGERELLERALAAESRGDMVPLARLAYASIGVDPDTLKADPDPSWSDAMYYAVECQDYVYNAGAMTDAERLAAFAAQARALGIPSTRLGALYYGDLPCLYWPGRPAADPRPAPIVAATYPTIVMVATTDPITPVANAIRLANRLTDVHVIIETGGPHVIFGWGLSCPDDLIANYLVKGTPIARAVTVCPGSVADDYVALAKQTAAAYADAMTLARSLADQVQNTNDYVYRLGKDPLAVGCDFGGVLTYRPVDGGTRLELQACAFTDGLPVTGTGLISDSGAFSLDVTLPGVTLRYRVDDAGKATLTGTFRGKPVSISG